MTPDWQLPPGVDRGLYDYFRSAEMAADYDSQMVESPLAAADVAFCEKHFPAPGKLIDLGCGTGRLCRYFIAKGYACVGVDLSDEMLAVARRNAPAAEFRAANLVGLGGVPADSFDYAACLFSTFGMIRGEKNRTGALAAFARVLKPGGVLVLHAHNRFFPPLGWRRFWTTEFPMPQAYGGAPLTLRHFSRRELKRMLSAVGFGLQVLVPVAADGSRPRFGHVYGYLTAAIKNR